MQILFTYTKLPVYKRLSGEPEHLSPPEPPDIQPCEDNIGRRVTWTHTGKFIECNGCIVFQWRGTFDHEREAERQLSKERIAKLQSIDKEAAEWRDENAFWEDWKKRRGEHNEAVEDWQTRSGEYRSVESERPPKDCLNGLTYCGNCYHCQYR